MQADRSIHVTVPFSRKEKKLDSAGGFLPLVADNRLHDISLWFLVFGQDGGRSVPGFQRLTGVVEEILIRDQVPVGMLVLEFDFHEFLLAVEVSNDSLEGRLDKALNSPGLASLSDRLVHDAPSGVRDGFGNFLGPSPQ